MKGPGAGEEYYFLTSLSFIFALLLEGTPYSAVLEVINRRQQEETVRENLARETLETRRNRPYLNCPTEAMLFHRGKGW